MGVAISLALSHQGHYEQVEADVQLQMRYLPDPMVVGDWVDNLGTEVKEAVTFPQGTAGWPDVEPFRLGLREDPGSNPLQPISNHWDASARLFSVGVQKAETYTLRLGAYLGMASGPTPAEAATMSQDQIQEVMTVAKAINQQTLFPLGLWHWIQEAGGSVDVALGGGYPMLTPTRDLTLIHAVQQPLRQPSFSQLEAPKANIGAKIAQVRGSIGFHGKSTVSLDIEATWSDCVDDLADDGPKEIARSTHLSHLVLNAKTESYNLNPKPLRHDFQDTKYHHVTYSATGTTRFQEYFLPTDGPFTRTGAETIHVNNSERPNAPQVLYVVPAFKWVEEVAQDGTVTRTRQGGILRVFLKRPWYSSGNGELLGVILYPYDTHNIPENDRQYVSRWGKDPIWQSNPLRPLDAANFVGTEAEICKSIRIAESSLRVDVAGFEAAYDCERKCWYADVHIANLANYFPFIRLALARFQPHSMEGAHLSTIVRTDFIQLTNDRTATIAFPTPVDADGWQSAQVTVSGPAPIAPIHPSGGSVPNKVEVVVQTRTPGENELDWEDGASLLLSGTIDPSLKICQWSGVIRYRIPQVSNLNTRLVIKEFEQFALDNTTQLRERLVYADIVEFATTLKATV